MLKNSQFKSVRIVVCRSNSFEYAPVAPVHCRNATAANCAKTGRIWSIRPSSVHVESSFFKSVYVGVLLSARTEARLYTFAIASESNVVSQRSIGLPKIADHMPGQVLQEGNFVLRRLRLARQQFHQRLVRISALDDPGHD